MIIILSGINIIYNLQKIEEIIVKNYFHENYLKEKYNMNNITYNIK